VLLVAGQYHHAVVFGVGILSLVAILAIATLLTRIRDTIPTLLSRQIGQAIDRYRAPQSSEKIAPLSDGHDLLK
jgi:hypothetical protein